MKILVVEDEPTLAATLKQIFEQYEHEVTVAYDGHYGQKLALENSFDVIMLDVLIPYINGLDVCKRLRNEGIRTPILILSAMGATDDKIIGLDAGADDYLSKPFDYNELLARLKALNRRFINDLPANKFLKIADIELDLEKKGVKRGGREIELTSKEFSLLEYLIRNKNRTISRAEIADKVWDIKFDTKTNVIDVYINFLRKKIDKEFPTKLIHTIVGLGYVLKTDELD